jgi:hypothetical protein
MDNDKKGLNMTETNQPKFFVLDFWFSNDWTERAIRISLLITYTKNH